MTVGGGVPCGGGVIYSAPGYLNGSIERLLLRKQSEVLRKGY